MAVLRPLLSAVDFFQERDVVEYCERSPAIPDEGEIATASNLEALAQTIEAEIVPRLMLAHRADIVQNRGSQGQVEEPTSDDVRRFAGLVIGKEVGAGRAFIDDLLARGVSLESVFLDLMAPAARHLGDLWVDDRCDFTTVTLGLSRMQQLLRALSPAFEMTGVGGDHGARALLVTYPGEQHTFGMYMVAEFFRRGGWEVWGGAPDDDDMVFDLVSDDRFDVLGVSVSLDESLRGLDRFLRNVRRRSRNPDIGVLVGGRALSGRLDLAMELGADAIAENGREAVYRARAMIGGVGHLAS